MELTRAEQQIMQIIWKLERGFVKEIQDQFNDPKPAYTTVATFLKILEKKGFVSHESFGNAHRFYPVISKDEYFKANLKPVFKKYFQNSMKDVVSFFSENNNVDIADIDNAIKLLTELKNKKP